MSTSEQGKQVPSLSKPQRDRSPAYPFISLKTAIDRVVAFEAKFGRHGTPYNKAGLAWGFKGDGSQAQQTTSALKYFGLVEYTGPTNDRMVILTDDARNYLRAQQASTKSDILRSCALRPKAMQTYWSRWGANRPIDEICLDQLIIKDGFTEGAAKIFLRVYDETLAFAGMQDGIKIDAESPVVAQVEDVQQEQYSLEPPRPHSAATVPGSATRSLLPQGAGMRTEVFGLAEGDVTIQFPERISEASLEDLTDWLRILQRKIKRNVLPAQNVAKPAVPEDDEL